MKKPLLYLADLDAEPESPLVPESRDKGGGVAGPGEGCLLRLGYGETSKRLCEFGQGSLKHIFKLKTRVGLDYTVNRITY